MGRGVFAERLARRPFASGFANKYGYRIFQSGEIHPTGDLWRPAAVIAQYPLIRVSSAFLKHLASGATLPFVP